LNVDGCIAVCFVDLLRDSGAFTPEEADEYIKIGTLNGLFVLGRSIGFIGHHLDQKRLRAPLYRHPADDIVSVMVLSLTEREVLTMAVSLVHQHGRCRPASRAQQDSIKGLIAFFFFFLFFPLFAHHRAFSPSLVSYHPVVHLLSAVLTIIHNVKQSSIHKSHLLFLFYSLLPVSPVHP
jgi:hypothetical protein